jgi:hypothetical protein
MSRDPQWGLLTELQDWLSARCDGEWEHAHGVTIRSTDNPGWWVQIDLVGTPLLGKPFPPIRRGGALDHPDDPPPPWLACSVEDGMFNGAGDPGALAEIVRLFLRWAGG